jgi:uncharacterized membrane protein
MSAPLFALTFLAALACALSAGVFYAFSTFVMAGLERLPAATAVAAMRSINVTAPRAPLMLVMFGATLLSLGAAVLALVEADGAARWLPALAAVLYLVGTMAVTMSANVPLNDRLDRVDPAGPEATEEWRHFLGPWRAWNHLRTLSGLAATAALIAALTV